MSVPSRARLIAVLAISTIAASLAVTSPAAAGPTETYVVLYKASAVPAGAATTIQRAGGTLVASYGEIGVVIARSSDPMFDDRMRADGKVDGAAATTGFASKLEPVVAEDAEAEGPPPGDLPNSPAPHADTFSPQQWDMRQIHAPEANAITGGSPAVVTGIIDTGVDKDHPDLVPNLDFSRSVSCQSGAPDSDPAAWDDRHGHGTHTAGTVGAAANGFGIVGTAPNAKIAAIKASTDEGYFFPEMVVCAFMHAGRAKLDVTNNSYFADPYYYYCRNDRLQHAIWKAEQRAIRFAITEGVTVVAAAGNFSDDLSHPSTDVISPDFPPGSEEEREVTNACVVVPVEVPGVIGVSAVGNAQQVDDEEGVDYLKSFYSNYGVNAIDLTAPGGDSIFGMTPEAPNGRVLSTWPEEQFCPPARRLVDPAPFPTGSTYCYAQGTSMASPHVAGVAALIVSRFGDTKNPQNGKMRPTRVEAYLQQTADPQPCPEEVPAGYPGHGFTGEPQVCQGGSGHNSWYGNGHLNALRAVTHASGN